MVVSAVARALEPAARPTRCLSRRCTGSAKSHPSSRRLWRMVHRQSEYYGEQGLDDHHGRMWIVEWAELDAVLRARSQNSVKAFVAQRNDTYRPPTDAAQLRQKRCSLIVGTTNEEDFLTDLDRQSAFNGRSTLVSAPSTSSFSPNGGSALGRGGCRFSRWRTMVVDPGRRDITAWQAGDHERTDHGWSISRPIWTINGK